MVISGSGSTLDFYEALEIIASKMRNEATPLKNKMGTTHVQRHSISPNSGDSPNGASGPHKEADHPEGDRRPANDDLRNHP